MTTPAFGRDPDDRGSRPRTIERIDEHLLVSIEQIMEAVRYHAEVCPGGQCTNLILTGYVGCHVCGFPRSTEVCRTLAEHFEGI